MAGGDDRIAPELIERFSRDLDSLCGADTRLGLAVSGGSDSLALLALSAAARPGQVEAATVDHDLRPESAEEADRVAAICKRFQVPHRILKVSWKQKPQAGLQERARNARYKLLSDWTRKQDLAALVTAHQLDDQAETVLMRLARGAGVNGLAGMRRAGIAPGSDVPLIRPLLAWRRAELEDVCASLGLEPVDDPSNSDPRFERVRFRELLAQFPEIDLASIGRSAAHLAQADRALGWASAREWKRAVTINDREIRFRPSDLPMEIRRRIVAGAIARLAREGQTGDLRGRELDTVMIALRGGRRATIRGVLCTGGREWSFIPAPVRTRPVRPSR